MEELNNKKITSIKVNPELWESFKIYCIKKKIEMGEKIEEFIKRELEQDGR